MSKAAKLKTAAASAAEVRAYQTDPDVVALRVERVRGWVDRLIWTGMVAGLLFTMANVAHFAAGTAKPGSLVWVTAWLLDPMVSLVLIGVLMGEQIINRHKLNAGGWVRITKWVALGCTYSMNTWSAWAALNPAQILLHSVPPAIVFCAAEAVVTIRQRITEAVTVAYEEAAERNTALQQARTAARADGNADPQESAQRTRQLRADTSHADAPAERVGSAHAELPAKATRTPVETPRGKAGAPVDREALVVELAEQIRDAVHAGEQWRPDYPALMTRTGYRRRWCEEVVRDAKLAVLSADDGADSAQAIDVRAPLRTDEPTDDPARVRADDADSAGDSATGADAGTDRPRLSVVTDHVGVGGER